MISHGGFIVSTVGEDSGCKDRAFALSVTFRLAMLQVALAVGQYVLLNPPRLLSVCVRPLNRLQMKCEGLQVSSLNVVQSLLYLFARLFRYH